MKHKVLFIGSFRESAKDGSVGGQMYACSTLINSSLKNDIDFVLIDSTADSVPAPPVYRRLIKAVNRLVILLSRLFNRNVISVLIFSSAGFSLIEKGLMVFICKLFRKKVLFAPRSGLIKDNCDSSDFFKWYITLIIKCSDRIICQGTAWKSFYKEVSNADDSKFLVIPNWIDPDPYIQNRPEYHINKSIVTILYMGWLEDYKGIFDFLKCIYQLKKTGLTFKGKICGMGSAKEQMLNLINDYELSDVIEYVGWVTGEKKMKEFREIDIFVLPSHREGMPNVLMEAMASGIPVVATKVGGVPELIEDGVNGFLVESESSDQLSEAIEKLINSEPLRMKFSKNGRAFIVRHNSVEHITTVFRKELL